MSNPIYVSTEELPVSFGDPKPHGDAHTFRRAIQIRCGFLNTTNADLFRAGRISCVMPPHRESSAPAASMTPRVFCKGCGYALVGLSSNQCPECGRGFDPGNPRSFARRPPRGWMARWGRRVAGMLVLLVLAGGLGVGWLWWGWQQEQKTVGQLRLLDSQIEFQEIGPHWMGKLLGDKLGYLRQRVHGVTVYSLKQSQVQDLDLRALGQLEALTLYNCDIDDRVIVNIGQLTRLRRLRLPRLDSEGLNLAPFSRLENLRELYLSGRAINDTALKHVAARHRLEELSLYDTAITDDGLRHLQSLGSLQRLYIYRSSITDAGLAELKSLASLRHLGMAWTGVTRAGVERMKKEVPSLDLDSLSFRED